MMMWYQCLFIKVVGGSCSCPMSSNNYNVASYCWLSSVLCLFIETHPDAAFLNLCKADE